MKKYFLIPLVLAALIIVAPNDVYSAGDATLFVNPSKGTFSVGETFTVSILLDTGGSFINATKATLSFPPDKLQVVSPSVGKSFIDIWVGQPKYSNSKGTLEFQGAVPSPGIKVSNGLVSTVTFRVKQTGLAEIKFLDDSAVLLNDGNGTNVLGRTTGAVYDLVLPPPQGPIVSSDTHPDQLTWYQNDSTILSWLPDSDVTSYSYILDDEPLTIPDNIPEGNDLGTSYKQLKSGTNYFHIKALSKDVWGATTHFAINVDNTEPAEFNVEIDPSARTSSRTPIIRFATTDAHSGISHYELKIVSTDKPTSETELSSQQFFIETESPYIPEILPLGKYDIIVRAYDQAGNVREEVVGAHILTGLGITRSYITSPPAWLWLLLILVFIIVVLIMLLIRNWHKTLHLQDINKGQRHSALKEKHALLKHLSSKYKKKVAVVTLLFLTMSTMLGFNTRNAHAEIVQDRIYPPIIIGVSQNISNEDIFYISGKHPTPKAKINIFVQNIDTGATIRFDSYVDDKGDWFYADSRVLGVGEYDVWANAELDLNESATTQSVRVKVDSVVIDLGFTRINKEFIYGFISLVLLVCLIILSWYTFKQFVTTRRRNKIVNSEILEIERELNKAFDELHSHIESEVEDLLKIRKSRKLREEELELERKLLLDLELVKSHLKEELSELEAI